MMIFPKVLKRSFATVAVFGVIFVQAGALIAYAVTPPVDPDLYTGYYPIAKDSYIDQSAAKDSTNYGDSSAIDVKSKSGDENRRILVQSTLPPFASSITVESAKLYMYMYNEASNSSNRTYGAYRILNSWIEGDGGTNNNPVGEVRWNNKPNASTSPTTTTTITPGNGQWVAFDVTNDVKKMASGEYQNNGWMLQDMSENSSTGYLAQFRSKEYSVNNACPGSPSTSCKPYLELVYHKYNGGIFGSVWNDVNHDGIKDPSELPQANQVISAIGPISTTTTSDVAGAYFFSQLPSGTYTVCQSGTNSTLQSAPTTGVSCPNSTFGMQVTVPGDLTPGPDFGVYQTGNVRIVLHTNPNITSDAFDFALLKDNATTSEHVITGAGEYVFANVIPGTYSLNTMLPNRWATTSVSCIAGETGFDPSALTVNANDTITCTVDVQKNAVLTVTNYIQPVEGSYSFMLTQQVDLVDTIVFTPVTLGNAESHTFTDVTPGTYNLIETIEGGPSGETAVCLINGVNVDPRVGPIEIPAGADIQCTYNHGEFAVVQGNVFEDMNANGVQDEEDASRAGWVVKLFKITEEMVNSGDEENPVMVPTQVVTELGSKITSAAGYVFGQLNPGVYKVCEEVQSGSTQSFPVTGEDCTGSKGHFVTLNFGDVVTKHFGNFSKGSVMGIVFGDTNNNGTQDEGETGLSGVAVTLGSYSATTDTTGQYSFADVQPAEYTLTIVPPANSSYSVPTAGNYAFTVSSGGNYVHKDFGVFTDTDTPALPTHVSPVDGSVVKASGLVLDWSDAIDPSASAVTYLYQSSLSNATTTGNALSTPIYSTSLSISQIDASGTSEGTYFWQVKACDVAHNCTDWTNPWAITVDNTAPVSVFATPTSDVTVEDDFVTISGTTTDAHMVASTTLAFAPYTLASESETASCGAYANIVSLVNPIASTTYAWTYNWTPVEDGVYCLTAHGQDEAGNVEASPVITNITFKKKIVVVPTNTDNGGSGGNGGGSSGSAGGNGPIVGAFGIGGSFMSGAPSTEVALGGNTVDTGLPTSPSTQNTESTGNEGATTYETTGRGIAYGGVPALTDSSSTSSTTRTENDGPVFDEGAVKSQLAAIGSLGEWSNWYWLWILIVLIIIGGVYYSTRDRNK